ncbi:hypothetical protein [Nitrosospira sp. Is2]|uniref:hypothetical protein n=1 Tax=Nitrosospira sp. Is2 TaxID=3080532 RepID=UPI002954A55A|nr:hypothetical protein [Nitrosospira sp. Is2]WON72913.1 hypothetical protein R5L00_10450 [Nitrosospira sp. Is2]
MSAVVIDTNVLLVANRQHHDISEECILACVQKLLDAQGGIVVVDNEYRIFNEYQNKTNPNNGSRMGDAFLKWLLQNQANTQRVHKMSLTETAANEFAEFPDPSLQASFDAPDRKFAAVAHAHPDKPPVWQAADCKWLNWWPALHGKGVRVDFLCPDDVCKFYGNKFPNIPLPALPVV